MSLVFSSGHFGSNEPHAHGFGFLGEVVQDALAVVLLEVVLSPLGVFLFVVE